MLGSTLLAVEMEPSWGCSETCCRPGLNSVPPRLPAPPAAFPTAPRRRVQPFGSCGHGVSLPGADLDVVVTGLMTPIARGGGERVAVLSRGVFWFLWAC
jgi:hypothetical protein